MPGRGIPGADGETRFVLRWADGPSYITGEDYEGNVVSQIVQPYYREFKTQAGAQRAARDLQSKGAHNIRVSSYKIGAGQESPHGFAAQPIRPAPKMLGATPDRDEWEQCENCGKLDPNVDKRYGDDLCSACRKRQNQGFKK